MRRALLGQATSETDRFDRSSGRSARLTERKTLRLGFPLTHGLQLRIAVGCADRDPDEPVTTGTHLTSRIRRTEHEVTRSERNLFTLDEHRSAAADYRVHLFLAVSGVVVLRPFPIRWKLKPIDLELAHPKRRANPRTTPLGASTSLASITLCAIRSSVRLVTESLWPRAIALVRRSTLRPPSPRAPM